MRFLRRAAAAAKRKIIDFLTGVRDHTEATVIEVAAAVGLTAALSELPFIVALPMWVEASMFIPVLSVGIVVLLIKSAEYRAKRRGVVVVV